jgi:hypothetical protein
MLTHRCCRGAGSTAAAAGKADVEPPSFNFESGRAEEELDDPVDDEAEKCCSCRQRAELGITTGFTHPHHSKMRTDHRAQVNSNSNITSVLRHFDFLALVLEFLELVTSPSFPVWCRAIYEHESCKVS